MESVPRGRHRLQSLATISALICVCAVTMDAAELTSETNHAYDAYVKEARQAFLSRVQRMGDAKHTVEQRARPGRDGGILKIPGGLLHHWIGAMIVPHATVQRAIDVSASYSTYTAIYKEVIACRLVARDGDTYHVVMRLRDSAGGLTAVLEVHATIQYVRMNEHQAYSISHSDEIHEVENAGTPNERLLPAGHDSGYLWRASTFTAFSERPEGLYLEAESLGLSRRFPPLLGWVIEPIARRLGRKSIEGSLQEFASAMQKDQ
jgi:hypothetical protein